MRDTILTAILTFVLLAAGTVAIGGELLRSRPLAPTDVVTLPKVLIVGHRTAAGAPRLAVATSAWAAQRVE